VPSQRRITAKLDLRHGPRRYHGHDLALHQKKPTTPVFRAGSGFGPRSHEVAFQPDGQTTAAVSSGALDGHLGG